MSPGITRFDILGIVLIIISLALFLISIAAIDFSLSSFDRALRAIEPYLSLALSAAAIY